MLRVDVQIFIIIILGTSDCQIIPRIEECGLACSQGIHCKSKPASESDIFNSFCRVAPTTSSATALKSMKLSTVMKCVKGSQCFLHLNVKGTLSLSENIRGLEICYLSLDTQQTSCMNVRFSRKTNQQPLGRKIQVQFNCFEVKAAQHIYVTMKTIPNYCEVKLSQEYYVEDCRNNDVGKHIPSCSAGKLDYSVDRAKKVISVNISHFPGDQDYYVRLCHKWFICEDAGALARIKGKESLKSISLQYSQLLPCLCIEGWEAVPDARRIQLCPFKNDTKALWDNIMYNSATQTLAWEQACPVQVRVSLCRLMKSNYQCVDLPNSSYTVPENVCSFCGSWVLKLTNSEPSFFKHIRYSRVDSHPGLCMKFTTKQGSWIRCPFAHGKFPVWKMRIAGREEQIQVSFTSQTKAQLSVLVCNQMQLSSCESVGTHYSVSLGGSDSTSINIPGEICSSKVCIQAWRTDVDYSVPLQICDIQCALSSRNRDEDENSLKVISLTAIILLLATILTVLGHKFLTVFHQRTHEGRSPAHLMKCSSSTGMKSTQPWH